jgi:hypothetical protein
MLQKTTTSHAVTTLEGAALREMFQALEHGSTSPVPQAPPVAKCHLADLMGEARKHRPQQLHGHARVLLA